jgi:hypothetical protein
MTEQWVAIQGFSNYEISTCGQVRRRVAYHGQGRHYPIGHVVKGRILINGYAMVGLISDKGKRFHLRRCRMVLNAFIGADPSLQANHKNGNKCDDRLDNLEWVTAQQNCLHAYKVLGIQKPKGSKHHNSKLTETKVREAQSHRDNGKSHYWIARQFKVSRPTITAALSGRNWKHMM